ncbi:altered inheritance of mitochondria protein 31, mitochondrial [Dactylonectria estremocensis]|uniref:Altered inheritance of mitochondria protein 31, mitochondrial n=1 Tax=Dactylonectria estremocensis TaxID=1079267 RepID=A0A9P9F593_9HYPO|nr:altered inheritance of mitochondria protein 31, mitochondrial [Dactylonectria estremocensis]
MGSELNFLSPLLPHVLQHQTRLPIVTPSPPLAMADGPPHIPGPMPSSFDIDHERYNEGPLQKVMRKIKEEPLIPLGMGLTTLAFVNSYRALRRGDSKAANRMFRARVAAQGFTVLAMVAGSMYYNKDREKTKELRKLKEERDAEEKRIKWIRELEARDEEEKAFKAHLMKKSKMAAAPAPAEEPIPESEPTSNGKGGILGKIGLWPQSENKDAPEVAVDEAAASEKQARKKNPKSSLGDLGEIISTKNKEDADSKKD